MARESIGSFGGNLHNGGLCDLLVDTGEDGWLGEDDLRRWYYWSLGNGRVRCALSFMDDELLNVVKLQLTRPTNVNVRNEDRGP